MKWIKASDLYNLAPLVVPEKGKEVFIKYDGGKDRIVGDSQIIEELYRNGWEDIEWLNESPSTNKQSDEGLKDWISGDKFTTPETGDKIFTVISVSKNYVEAYDARSRAGVTSFAKSYINKIPTPPNNIQTLK